MSLLFEITLDRPILTQLSAPVTNSSMAIVAPKLLKTEGLYDHYMALKHFPHLSVFKLFKN